LSLALHRPLEELQQDLSWKSFSLYQSYRRKHGSLDPALRNEIASARLAFFMVASRGGKMELSDIYPFFVKSRNQESLADVGIEDGLDPEIVKELKKSDRRRS
jgi:hypothetical protein